MRFATHDDIPRIEEICNNPVIRIWTAPKGWPACKAEPYVIYPNFTIIGDEGCLLVAHIDTNRYALHVNLLPHCRGQKGIAAGKEAMAMVFSRPEVGELFAVVPRCIPQSIWMARKFGFIHQFDKPAMWDVGGVKFDVCIYQLTREQWIMRLEGDQRKKVCHA